MYKRFTRCLLICLLATSMMTAHAEIASCQEAFGELACRKPKETSICEGKLDNGNALHVVVDWDSDIVKINRTNFKLEGSGLDSKGLGIFTEKYINQFGRLVYYYIVKANAPYHGNFLVQIDANTRVVITSLRLSCIKSFDKPFMARMLGRDLP